MPTKAGRTPPQRRTFEVLTETVLGHRTVHRVDAESKQAAEEQVKSNVAPTTAVLGVTEYGQDPGAGGRS